MLFAASAPGQAQFLLDGDLSVRYDDTSKSDGRGQYRLRVLPSYEFDNGVSLHAFLATGDEYDSAYNTIDQNDDEFHVRHLFARFENERGKLELGAIPPYKGRVSSTGLSKEGWVKGLRGVLRQNSGDFEIVLGELDDLRAQDAISLPAKVNYVEVEYSGRLNDLWSFEVSVDRMLQDNFLRGELRYETAAGVAYALEAVRNASENANKFVVSMERSLTIGPRPIDWFIYYAYAEAAFGPRAELTEDFLDFGHAFAMEFSGAIADSSRWAWFTKAEVYENRVRGQLGLEFDFR